MQQHTDVQPFSQLDRFAPAHGTDPSTTVGLIFIVEISMRSGEGVAESIVFNRILTANFRFVSTLFVSE